MSRLVFTFLLCSLNVYAQHCPSHDLAAYLTENIHPKTGVIYAEADEVEGTAQQLFLRGQVSIRQDEKRFIAPEIQYFPHEKRAFAPQKALFANPYLVSEAEALHFDGKQEALHFENAHYYLARHQSWGRAARADLKRDAEYLYDVSWTTCPVQKPLWQLQARSLHFDQKQGRAHAKDVRLLMKGIPLFYLPYFSYPLNDERQSGFLLPDLASTEAMGVALRLPYYWNIAPNQDATFTTQIMSKKGLLLQGEYRYLGRYQSAYIQVAKRLARQHEGHHILRHQYQNGDWASALLWQSVAHPDYLQDYRPEDFAQEAWYLPRYWRLRYGSHWRLLWADEQIASPYVKVKAAQRLPQLRYQNQGQLQDWTWHVDAEATHFRQREALSGQRYRLHAGVSRLFGGSAWSLEPQILLDAHHYRLQKAWHHSSIIPTLRLDAASHLWRPQGDLEHHLRPRLQYQYRSRGLNRPPSFDSSLRTPDWENLWAAKRFSGGDRFDASKRFTLGLEQSWRDAYSGREWAQFNVLWQHDRALKNQEGSASVLALDARWQPHSNWAAMAFQLYDLEQKRSIHQRLQLHYRPHQRLAFNLTYRQHPQAPTLWSFSGDWQFNEAWRLWTRHDYDWDAKRFLQHRLAVAQEDCCWAWRLGLKRHRASTREAWRNALYLEFELKGLGSMGRSSRNMVQHYGLNDATQESSP